MQYMIDITMIKPPHSQRIGWFYNAYKGGLKWILLKMFFSAWRCHWG